MNIKNRFFLIAMLISASTVTVLAQNEVQPQEPTVTPQMQMMAAPPPDPDPDPDPGDGGGGDPPPPDPCQYGPSGSPAPTNINASSGICEGKTVLSYNGTPPDNVVWVWYHNGTRLTNTAVNDAMTATTKSFNAYSSGTYKLYREWEYCNNGPKAYFYSKTVSVTPAPSVSITKNESTSCVGQNVTLTANTSNFGSNPTYAWRQNGVGPVLHTGRIFKIPEDEYVTPGNRSFTVTVTGVSTCNGESKTDTESIEIPGTLSSLEFLGGGLYCEEESDNINAFIIRDANAKRDLWIGYEFEVWKSTNGSTFNTLVANEKGINHDFKSSGEHYGNDHYFQLTMTPRDGENFGTGWYKLKMIKSGCTPLWDENVLTTEAVTYQEVNLLPGSEYIYKCEDNYVEIHTTHPDAVLYSSYSDMTPVSGLDYSGSSIKGNLPACDFDCSYYVGLPSGYCVSPARKEVAFRKVGPVLLTPKVFPPQDVMVECIDSRTDVVLKIDPSRDLTPPVSHPESFPVEETNYPVRFKWYGANLPVLSDENVNNEITVNIGLGQHTYQVAAYTTLCPDDNLPDGPKGTVGPFTITNEKPEPDVPVLENLTTCFTGMGELKASGFEEYTWYKNGSTSGITETGDVLTFPLDAANLGTYKITAKYGDDVACVTDFSDEKTVSFFTEGECDDYLNYVADTLYDEFGVAMAASKNYFDLAGEALQSQSTTYDASGQIQVMATQTIKDTYGRDVLQTLPAALNRTDFLYKHEFVTKSEGADEVRYQSAHFDGDAKNSPDPVAQNTPGTLGWYYSANNTLEDNVPQTAYPYTRTDFYEDGSGEVKRSAAPGEALHMGTGHESLTKTLPVGNQMQELKHYDALRQFILDLDDMPTLDRVYKQVSIDPDRKEVVSYQTEAGTIATAIVKSSSNHLAEFEGELDEADNPRPIEIHVPRVVDVATGDELNSEITLTNPDDLKVYNKILDEADQSYSLVDGKISLPKGIYTLDGVEKVSYNTHYAEYSYNFYDIAGRLAASMAPLGVQDIFDHGIPTTKRDGTAGEPGREDLLYTTFYYYDYQGRLIEMDEPDAGVTKYLYRKDGSIRFSENELQREQNRFSYTCYDVSGRPVESGEYTGTDTFTSRNTGSTLEAKGRSGYDADRTDWVETYYDLAYENQDQETLSIELATYMDSWYTAQYGSGHGYNVNALAGNYLQDFLEGAVSYTKNNHVTTWYSYDEFGQVTFIVMKYENMGDGQYFTIDYEYDYFGNVIEVAYQKHFAGESFYHHYEYNDNQQLSKVYTSQAGADDPYKYLHATYHYYLHGPLKRIELAEDLQGLDYTYTAQGWLKAINSPANNLDPGGDGPNDFFHDAFGMEIDYYNGDQSSNKFSSVNAHLETTEQFGGNIRAITWGREGVAEIESFAYVSETLDAALNKDSTVFTQEVVVLSEGFDTNGFSFESGIDPRAVKVKTLEVEAQQYEYSYDFKNQLTEAVYTDAVASAAPDDRYAVKGLSYDANGNIQTLQRHDEAATLTDDFIYNYAYELDETHEDYGVNNQLNEVSEYSTYKYNTIGQMTASIARTGYGSQYYDYDVTGKVTAIYSDEAKMNAVATYQYDDRGFRIMKEANGQTTWYVRDASGNIIAIYEDKGTGNELSELPIYGSGKIGTSFRDPLKHKYSYELTDHLGNVRSVISKLKFYEVATMETASQFTESAVFENWSTHRQMDALFNTTNINGDEKYSVRLDGSNGAVGPAMSRAVKKGDKVSFHAQAMYVDGFTSSGLADDMFGLIAGAYGVTSGGETQAIYDGLNAAVASASGFLATPPSGVPKAYIQCLIFDKDFNDITPNHAYAMVSQEAAGHAGTAEEISQEIEITEDGYIYLYVANETKDAQVHFDDITVGVLGFDISEMTDYYPGGSVANHWEKEPYRFGYQGEYSEEDEETGFNHFEARVYDPIILRWMVVDPARQHKSPYVSMRNNWIRSVDPDGREDLTKDAATLALADQYATTASRLPYSFNPLNRAAELGYIARGRDISWLNNTSFEETQRAIEHATQTREAWMNIAAIGIGTPMLVMVGGPVVIEANGTIGGAVNKGAANLYLYATGNTAAFTTVSGFTLSIGRIGYRYHGSISAAARGRWTTTSRYSSSGEAFNKLALDYGVPNAPRFNMAQIILNVRMYGIHISGTAAPQNMTSGGGQQMLRVLGTDLIQK